MKELAQHVRNLLGIRLTAIQLQAFEIYERELIEWNARINLTAIRDPGQVRIKHFLDSLTCLSVMHNQSMEKVVDVGTGAGFPGIPLKIVAPDMGLTLIESVGKKAQFCQHLITQLKLRDVHVIQERAEVIGHKPEHRQQYDWALARAIAIMPVLAEYLLPLVRVGGAMLAMKSGNILAETQSADNAFKLLGGRLRKISSLSLPAIAEDHHLVVVDKISATPEKFPRRTGIPSKRPL